MKYRTFTIYNIVGAGLWAVGITTLGYYLGQVDIVREHVEIAAIIIVAVSLIPVAIEFVKHRREAKQEPEQVVSDTTDARCHSHCSPSKVWDEESGRTSKADGTTS